MVSATVCYELPLSLPGPGFSSRSGQFVYVRIVNGMCFEINISDREEGSMLSSIMCDHWWHFKMVTFKCHQDCACDKITNMGKAGLHLS